ncbi:MAG: hypothetical protein C0502_00575 [Opitutus sp.]|nr:hypothetical protein [Opitutus sp.]
MRRRKHPLDIVASICAYAHIKSISPVTTHHLVRLLAGSVTLLGAALAWFVHPYWILLPAFVGLNLIQSVFTGFCPPTLILRKLGWVDGQDVIRWGGRNR